MRYLANNLVWRGNRLTDVVWIGSDGASLDAAFAFGGAHGWQYPTADLRTFAAMPLCVAEARAWIARAPFRSLLAGIRDVSPWQGLVEEMLGVSTSGQVSESGLQLDGNDQVLRLGVPAVLVDQPEETVVSVLRARPDLARWHLHLLRPYDRAAVRRSLYA